MHLFVVFASSILLNHTLRRCPKCNTQSPAPSQSMIRPGVENPLPATFVLPSLLVHILRINSNCKHQSLNAHCRHTSPRRYPPNRLRQQTSILECRHISPRWYPPNQFKLQTSIVGCRHNHLLYIHSSLPFHDAFASSRSESVATMIDVLPKVDSSMHNSMKGDSGMQVQPNVSISKSMISYNVVSPRSW
jgi:hypothetical protein